jgi:hypothetical protein
VRVTSPLSTRADHDQLTEPIRPQPIDDHTQRDANIHQYHHWSVASLIERENLDPAQSFQEYAVVEQHALPGSSGNRADDGHRGANDERAFQTT